MAELAVEITVSTPSTAASNDARSRRSPCAGCAPASIRDSADVARPWRTKCEEEGVETACADFVGSLSWYTSETIRESNMTSPGEMSGQREAARQQSRSAWAAVASGWHAQREELWKASRPVSEWMVRRLDPQPGDTVLELAAGLGDTGFMAARLVGEAGRVIVTDFTPEMLAAARRRAEELGVQNAEFRTLDAERMDLATDSVGGVLCRWAYMLMIDPSAAFAETRRVLRPGGRLAFSVWAARERNPALSLVGRILELRGHIPPPGLNAPTAFAMANPGRIRELVVAAGF